jgi:hypothetical protein
MTAHQQRGAIAVLTALALPAMIALCGLALELAMAYQRQAQMQQIADTAALSAAQQLDGTAAGVREAFEAAEASTFERQVKGVWRYFWLNESTMSFAADPAGSWLDYAAAQAAPLAMRYVRVDLASQGGGYTSLPRAFGAFLGGSAVTTVGARATAGPNGLRVLPLAICAASNTPLATRPNGGGANERVEYGFRYGVGYNLLALNPAAGAGSGEYFLVDPLSPPGSAALASSTEDSQVAPFMCAGKLAYPSLAGALHLRRGAAFGLWRQLNSRFNVYGGDNPCNPYDAPPDSNVREYRGAQANWMSSNPPHAAAEASTPAAGQPLMTVADGAPVLPAIAPARYGTLWAYGAARKSDGGTFATWHWSALYPSTSAMTSGTPWPGNFYPVPPYINTNFSTAPVGNPGRPRRRLLYVPLLSCPVAAGVNVEGTVLAVARFLLTAQASASEVPGEFAGILSAAEVAALAGDVELLR